MTVREAMIEMDTQADPVREALRRMLAEFGDEHYHTCPADDGTGPCDCFAGHLINECLKILTLAMTEMEKVMSPLYYLPGTNIVAADQDDAKARGWPSHSSERQE